MTIITFKLSNRHLQNDHIDFDSPQILARSNNNKKLHIKETSLKNQRNHSKTQTPI